MSIAAKGLGSPRNGMPGRAGYVWRGDPALSENALKSQPRKAAKAPPDPEAKRYRPRDVPASCICEWHWVRRTRHWVRPRTRPGCPWHTGRAA